jgi:hypothetical protein
MPKVFCFVPLIKLLPGLAHDLISARSEYSWLAESLQSFPDKLALLQLLFATGWQNPGHAVIGRHGGHPHRRY